MILIGTKHLNSYLHFCNGCYQLKMVIKGGNMIDENYLDMKYQKTQVLVLDRFFYFFKPLYFMYKSLTWQFP